VGARRTRSTSLGRVIRGPIASLLSSTPRASSKRVSSQRPNAPAHKKTVQPTCILTLMSGRHVHFRQQRSHSLAGVLADAPRCSVLGTRKRSNTPMIDRSAGRKKGWLESFREEKGKADRRHPPNRKRNTRKTPAKNRRLRYANASAPPLFASTQFSLDRDSQQLSRFGT
jgi:hypothetical protein